MIEKIQLIASVLTAIGTAIYVVFTYRIMRSSVAQSAESLKLLRIEVAERQHRVRGAVSHAESLLRQLWSIVLDVERLSFKMPVDEVVERVRDQIQEKLYELQQAREAPVPGLRNALLVLAMEVDYLVEGCSKFLNPDLTPEEKQAAWEKIPKLRVHALDCIQKAQVSFLPDILKRMSIEPFDRPGLPFSQPDEDAWPY